MLSASVSSESGLINNRDALTSKLRMIS